MLRMKIIISTYSSPKNHSVPVYAHYGLGKMQVPFITQFQLCFHHGFLENIFIYSLAIIYTIYIHIYTHTQSISIYIHYIYIYISIHYNFIYTMVISIPYSPGHFPHNKYLTNFHILFFLYLSNYH